MYLQYYAQITIIHPYLPFSIFFLISLPSTMYNFTSSKWLQIWHRIRFVHEQLKIYQRHIEYTPLFCKSHQSGCPLFYLHRSWFTLKCRSGSFYAPLPPPSNLSCQWSEVMFMKRLWVQLNNHQSLLSWKQTCSLSAHGEKQDVW